MMITIAPTLPRFFHLGVMLIIFSSLSPIRGTSGYVRLQLVLIKIEENRLVRIWLFLLKSGSHRNEKNRPYSCGH